MSKKKELVINTIIIFLGKISTQFLSFLLLPIYTAKLDTNDYGTVDLILTYITLLVPLLVLELEMAAFRFLIDARNESKKISKVLSSVFNLYKVSMTIFLLIYIIICIFTNLPFKEIIFFNIIASIYANLLLQISRGLGKNKNYAISCFLTGITTIFSNIILIILLNVGAKGILISNTIGNIVCIIYLIISLKIYKIKRNEDRDKKIEKELIQYSWPLVPNSICWWIINAADRTIVSLFLGVSSNGIYAISTKFSSIISSFFSIFGLSWTESASLHINDSDKDLFFSQILNDVIKLFSVLCLGLIAFMPLIFKILINKSYDQAFYYIPISIVSAFFSCVVGVYSSIYVALKKTKQVASTSILAAIINLLTNLILIKFIGLYAASISTVIAYFSMSIYRHIDLRKYIEIKYNKSTLIIIFIAFFINIFLYYQKNTVCDYMNMGLSMTFAILFNREMIINIIKEFIKKIKFNSQNKEKNNYF